MSLIPLQYFTKNFHLNFKPTSLLLQGVSDQIQTLGEILVEVYCPDTNVSAILPLIVCESAHLKYPLLGRSWLDVLFPDWRKNVCLHNSAQSLQATDHVSRLSCRFPNVFSANSASAIKGFSMRLTLKPNVFPKFCSPYTLPYSLQDVMSNMLSSLQAEGKLVKVDSAEWASPDFLVPKKNGQYRLCVDLKRTLNPCLETIVSRNIKFIKHYNVYPLPTLENIFATLNGSYVFCVLDLSEAYTQLRVSPESQAYLTINTHQGLFKFTRLVYGVSNAPALFQRFMDTLLQGIPKAVAYLDDILIQGADLEECLEYVTRALKKLHVHNVRIQPLCVVSKLRRILGPCYKQQGTGTLPVLNSGYC